MAFFYIEILAYNGEVSVAKTKCFVALNMTMLVVTLFRYYVHGQAFTLVEMAYPDEDSIFFTSKVNIAVVRITRYVS